MAPKPAPFVAKNGRISVAGLRKKKEKKPQKPPTVRGHTIATLATAPQPQPPTARPFARFVKGGTFVRQASTILRKERARPVTAAAASASTKGGPTRILARRPRSESSGCSTDESLADFDLPAGYDHDYRDYDSGMGGGWEDVPDQDQDHHRSARVVLKRDHKNEWAQRRLHEAQERVQHSAMFAIATVLSEGSTMTENKNDSNTPSGLPPLQPVGACPECGQPLHAVSDNRLTVTLVTIEGAKSYSVSWTCSSTSCAFSSDTAGDNAMPLQFVLAALVLATPSGKSLWFANSLLDHFRSLNHLSPRTSAHAYAVALSVATGTKFDVRSMRRASQMRVRVLHEISKIFKMTPLLTDCAACGNSRDAVFVDGCFKLKHRKGTTDDLDRPDIKESPIRSFFVAEKLVHDELALSKSSVGNAKNRDDDTCESDMRANAEISTAHRKGYRVAGIFTGRCKHGTVLAMADIFKGESYAYFRAILRQLNTPSLMDLRRIFYDIGCDRLEKSTRTLTPELLNNGKGEQVQLVVPVLHAKMHTFTCQVLHDATYAEGSGFPVSEIMEVVHANQGQHGPATMSMTSGDRHQRLDDAEFQRTLATNLNSHKALAKRRQVLAKRLASESTTTTTTVPDYKVLRERMLAWTAQEKATKKLGRPTDQVMLARSLFQERDHQFDSEDTVALKNKLGVQWQWNVESLDNDPNFKTALTQFYLRETNRIESEIEKARSTVALTKHILESGECGGTKAMTKLNNRLRRESGKLDKVEKSLVELNSLFAPLRLTTVAAPRILPLTPQEKNDAYTFARRQRYAEELVRIDIELTNTANFFQNTIKNLNNAQNDLAKSMQDFEAKNMRRFAFHKYQVILEQAAEPFQPKPRKTIKASTAGGDEEEDDDNGEDEDEDEEVDDVEDDPDEEVDDVEDDPDEEVDDVEDDPDDDAEEKEEAEDEE